MTQQVSGVLEVTPHPMPTTTIDIEVPVSQRWVHLALTVPVISILNQAPLIIPSSRGTHMSVIAVLLLVTQAL